MTHLFFTYLVYTRKKGGICVTKECRIKLKDGEKEAELNFMYREENELIILDGIFQFFGIDINYEEVATKQLKIYTMYEKYYSDPANFRDKNGSAEQAEFGEIDNFKQTFERIREMKSNVLEDATEQHNPGMQKKNGHITYRCHYKCSKCGNSGNRYISRTASKISCHSCGHQMEPRQVNEDFTHDSRYNYYLAGLAK